jgi:hypothetical protein
MSDDIAIATWGLAIVTLALVIITGYYAKQTRNLVDRERKALQVAILKDELEQAIGPLFTFATAIRAAFHKENPTVDLNHITEGYDSILTLYLKRDYFDELMLKKPHLIDPQIMAHWIEEQWVRSEARGLERSLAYVSIHVNQGTLTWIQDIEQKYGALKKAYEQLTKSVS